jgi:hypothetical protein
LLALAVVPSLSLAAASCADDPDHDSSPPSTDDPTAVVVDWSAIDTVDLGDGWTLEDGPGDAPYAAIRHDGAEVGIVELNAYPVDSLDAVTQHLDEGETAALDAHVDDFLEALAEDRAQGCGSDYSFEPEPRHNVQVGDGGAIRYGFAGGRAGEAVSERTLQWAAIRGDVLVLVNIAAYDPTSCISTEGAELTVSALAASEELLSEAVEASALRTVVAAVRPDA